MDKPLCRGGSAGDTRLGRLIAIAGGAASAAGGLGTALGWFTKPIEHIVFTLGPYAFTAAIVAGAVVGALLTAGLVIVSAVDRLSSREGRKACYAGVADTIVESFSSGWDTVFPFAAQHDRVDVVVKPAYWELVVLPPSEYVYCNDDSLASPLLRTYYYSSEIEGAAIGSIVGAAAGAIGGIILGLLAGVAIGCAGGPILCALAFLVALIVAAVVVLAAAFAGGNIGRAAAGESSPGGTAPGAEGSRDLGSGDYVSINGNLVVYPEDNNAIVAWWEESTTVHGRSTSGEGTGGGRPFNFTDPRDRLEPDACNIVTDEEPPPIR